MALDFLSKILAAEWEDGGSRLGVDEVAASKFKS